MTIKGLETPVLPPRRPPHLLTRRKAGQACERRGQAGPSARSPGRHPAAPGLCLPRSRGRGGRPSPRRKAPRSPPAPPGRSSAAGSPLSPSPAKTEPRVKPEKPLPAEGSPGAARPRGPYLEVDGRQLHGSGPPRDSRRRGRLTRGWAEPRRHGLAPGRPGVGGGAGGAGTPPRGAVSPRPAGPSPSAAEGRRALAARRGVRREVEAPAPNRALCHIG